MWYWVITGFGFLFSLRAVRARADEKRTSLSAHGLWRETLDLIFSLLLLVSLYDVGASWSLLGAKIQEMGFLILWTAAYFLGKYQKKQDLFFICLAVLSYSVVAIYQQWSVQLSLVLVLACGLFLFQLAMKGLKYAVLFSRISNRMKGWPVLCLLAFCVAVALSGFAMLIF